MIKGKKIILGITASIAAYKSAVTIRLLRKEGAEVRVLMTPMAREFITPVTLSTLSGNPVLTDFFSGSDGTWNSHVDLGKWADIMVIAPLTACTMGKMVNGIADNLLVATYLSARCPVVLAPAMDLDMYNHPSIKRNLDILRKDGNIVIEPATGELASGLHGKGRMEEPEIIVKKINEILGQKKKTNPRKRKPAKK
jgi:phosphopantothenoylcysteine decarboxylase/phosphopantothenate--cysteine ligase